MEKATSLAPIAGAELSGHVTADEINSAHILVVRCAARLLDTGSEFIRKAVECGNLMIAKKAELGHGNWLPWLAENCPEISHDTASRYMKTANFARERILSSATSLRQALALLDEEKESNPDSRPRPIFAIKFALHGEPDKLNTVQRQTMFDEAKPLLQILEGYGFVKITV